MASRTPTASQAPAEFTLKAVATGVVLGIVFGAANAYLGLRVGMTVSASIPAAVMTVAAFRLSRSGGTILEANLSQTIGSASTSLATGTIFTIPALFLWGMVPPYLQVVALAFLGALLGLSAMIPLRRLLIVNAHDELPYPEGTACAEVLRATSGSESGASSSAWIFRGMAVGAAVKLLISLAFLFPGELRAALPVLPKAELALELAPALLGVGYILGYRQAAVCVAGALISAVVLTPLIAWLGEGLQAPLYPETQRLVAQMDAGEIWSRYVRYIGAGAVATAGILTVLRGLPTMVGGVRGRGSRPAPGRGRLRRAGRAAPTATCPRGSSSAASRRSCSSPGSCPACSPATWRRPSGPCSRPGSASSACCSWRWPRASSASSASRRSRPRASRSSRCSAWPRVFAAAGWTDAGARAAVLTVGTIVAIAASKAGDISQDLKTG